MESTRSELESKEALNSLMLGICGQLVHQPGIYKVAPCLKTIRDSSGLVCAAVMTPPHGIILYSHQGDFELGAIQLVKELLQEGWNLPGALGPVGTASVLAHAWSQVTGGRIEIQRRSKLFELRKVMTPLAETGTLQPATTTDHELITRWWYRFKVEIHGEADIEEVRDTAHLHIYSGDIYLWSQNSRFVSMAMKTRPTRNGISVSLVYTPPEERRQGYARACVSELSRVLLDHGRKFCTLFADTTNIHAINLYKRIGYIPICNYNEYKFIER